ncbi:hypothetical protein G9Q38_08945 [Pusillimonas sp. DMV24BSW_D]|uniref:hypothetical protein n=1 Tax=Neopusillimonas aestuarii TaxID=2716226 RepID=UPI00140E686B|nr:hypothetical protein [Pusillimonas sp. DMV24BSW_D]QIM49295.1 hypothetical protein G9Q38_08945 [Pusillimonas sp. DMV24BSW_D]
MRIFHYDDTDYFLTGYEEISDDASIPHAATDIPPPEVNEWPIDEVPVYDKDNKRWAFRKNDFWEVSVTEKCFYSGRDSDDPVYLVGDRGRTSYQSQLMHIANSLPGVNLPRVGRLPNFISTLQTIDHIDATIEQLEKSFSDLHSGKMTMIVGPKANHYHMLVEGLIGTIRCFLDDLATVLFLSAFEAYKPWRFPIMVDGFSTLFDEDKAIRKIKKTLAAPSGTLEDIEQIFKSLRSTVFGNNTRFLSTVQSMNNCYKHSVTASIGRKLFGRDYPTVEVVGIPGIHGSMSHLTYHNSSLRQIILGLKDYIRDLTARASVSQGKRADFDYVCICGGHRVHTYNWVLNGPLMPT